MEGSLELRDGRDAFRRRAWGDAFRWLAAADQAEPLGAEDLVRLGVAATLTGRDEAFIDLLERAHHGYLEAGDTVAAARCAFWVGFRLAGQGERGRAGGWLGRAARLVERAGRDCAERGYLLLPSALQHLGGGDPAAAYAAAGRALEVGERFADRDLVALALHLQGRARLAQGRVEEGLALLDEAMVAVATDELSPQVTGIVYCSVIDACQTVYALGRAHEWTAALSAWCDGQPDLVPFSGSCLLYRAEILQTRGAWRDALEEARRAQARIERVGERRSAGRARYRQGEVHRLLGELAAAEEAYVEAGRLGWEPQPGMALLRLAQGEPAAAAAAIRRVLSETAPGPRRARLLPAHVEITLEAGQIDEAAEAAGELEAIAREVAAPVLETMAQHALGAVALACGDAPAALAALRRAWRGWEDLDAPYESARARVLLGLACRALGDDEAAALQLDSARATFQTLGAAPDLARLDASASRAPPAKLHGLTPREREVLALLATGQTNRAIAAELFISEKTVARHVSNIFAKLGLTSRSAATAYAWKHDLLEGC